MSKEQKLHRTHFFLEYEPASDPTAYHPVGCMTTRALGSAGWDSSRITSVFSVDFLTDLLSIVQEKGRAGRRAGAGPNTDSYLVVASLESYVHLLGRIYKDPTGTDPEDFALFDKLLPLEAYRRIQMKQLLQVLSVLVLPHECQHIMVERYLANPYSVVSMDSPQPLPCGDACDFCYHKGLHPKFPAIVVEGVKRVLEDLFIGDHQISGNPTIDGGFVNAFHAYPGVTALCFASRAASPPDKATFKRLILMLFAAGILSHRVVLHTIVGDSGNPDTIVTILVPRLAMQSDRSLALNDDFLSESLRKKAALSDAAS